MPLKITDKIDELIAATRHAAMKDRWLDAGGVGVLLGRDRRYVLERLACRKDFPDPFPEGQPRWLESEVMEWALEIRRKENRKKAA